MGLPPNEFLLAPPRRSNDPEEWSRRQGVRNCLVGLPRPGEMPVYYKSLSARAAAAHKPVRQPLSPLKVEARNSYWHAPRCIMPKAEENWRDVRPVPLSARTVRELAYTRAETLHRERLLRLGRLQENGERLIDPQSCVVEVPPKPLIMHTRILSVQLPPITLDIPTAKAIAAAARRAPPAAAATASSQQQQQQQPATARAPIASSSNNATTSQRPFSAESPTTIRPPTNPTRKKVRAMSESGAWFS